MNIFATGRYIQNPEKKKKGTFSLSMGQCRFKIQKWKKKIGYFLPEDRRKKNPPKTNKIKPNDQ